MGSGLTKLARKEAFEAIPCEKGCKDKPCSLCLSGLGSLSEVQGFGSGWQAALNCLK